MKKKGFTIASIGWWDASQDGEGGVHLVVDPVRLSFAISCGILIKETDEYIAIARDYFPHPSDKACDQVRAREVILKKNIEWIKKKDF